jgi:sRNA-binding regulator protein Hfq
MNDNVRPLHANRDYGSQPQQRQYTPRPNDKGEFKAKGHDKQLQDAQYGDATVEVESISGTFYSGKLVRRDRYTVTLKSATGRERIIFKHAIECITVLRTGAEADLPKLAA